MTEPLFRLTDRCQKCGKTLRELMLLAMAADAGARVHPHPLDCEHGFSVLRLTESAEEAERSGHNPGPGGRFRQGPRCPECNDTGRKVTGGRCPCPAWDGEPHYD